MSTRAKTKYKITILPIKLKSPLKWAGGKKWLIDDLMDFWQSNPDYRLVEPFAGGASIALGLNPKKALLNDINEHLINFYNQIKKGLIITLPMVYDENLYYEYRNQFNELSKQGKSKTKEAAQLFYYLNKTGFNGLCRFNLKGEFNVPFGKYKSINYERDFSKYKEIFKNWNFSNKDFSKLNFKSTDFIYADPPYDVVFTQYSSGGFSWKDQERLAVLLSKHSGPVILSNQATKRIINLYKKLGFKLVYLNAPRMINCNGNRDRAKEVLALKNL